MIRRLYDFTYGMLALFGVASLLSLLWFYGVLWYEARTRPPCYRAAAVSPVARQLAARVASGLQTAARTYEPTFVQNAGGPVTRFAAGMAYPVVVREIPTAAEIGCDHLLTHFGSMSLLDLVGMVVDHAAANGQTVHPSLLRIRETNPSTNFDEFR